MGAFQIILAKGGFERPFAMRILNPDFPLSRLIHAPLAFHDFRATSPKSQQPLEHLTRKIRRQQRRQHRRPGNGQRSPRPPDMQAFIRRLLSGRAFPHTFHANRRRRQPLLDQHPLHATASSRIRNARTTRLRRPFVIKPNHQAASAPSAWRKFSAARCRRLAFRKPAATCA